MKEILEKQEIADFKLDGFDTGKMARMLAHEIKNPLSRIFLSVEQLKNPDVEELDSGFYFDMISQAGNEIDRIINELVASSLVSEIKLEKKNIIMLLRESLAISQEKMLPKSVRVSENYPNESLELEFDSEKIKTVFLNIISNAIESIDGNDGAIEIEANRKNNFVNVIIRDNGSGMSEETVDNLFVPFYSTKPRKLGLGLTAARNIIRAHHGRIEIKSELGKGTEVSVAFPFQ